MEGKAISASSPGVRDAKGNGKDRGSSEGTRTEGGTVSRGGKSTTRARMSSLPRKYLRKENTFVPRVKSILSQATKEAVWLQKGE